MAFDLDDQELAYTRKMRGLKDIKKENKNMKLPSTKKKVTLKDVSLGTNYDINKNLVKKYEKELTAEEIEEKRTIIDNFTLEHQDTYYMLLCHDRRDYTILHTPMRSMNSVFKDLIECLQNRGKIYGIDRLLDAGDVIEIWMMIDDEAYCYYFFSYESAVVEVEERCNA